MAAEFPVDVVARGLRTATTVVDVAASAAPTAGQVVTATDGTHATWQTPSGGGGGAPSGAAGGVLGGTYPNPGFAVDMATQSELDAVAGAAQPLDSDLTAIAALTTTAFGRSLLAAADAAGLRVLAGVDLTLLAPLASPALTGNPTAPTQTVGNNSTRIATTAFVVTAAADATPPVTFATDVTISATSEATANSVVSLAAFTPDGVSNYWLEFYCPGVSVAATAGASVILSLFDNGSVYGGANAIIAQWANPAAAAFITPAPAKALLITPSAASHQYSVRGWRSGGNGVARGSAGGLSLPGYIRVFRAT